MKRRLKRLHAPRNGIQYIIDPETRRELSPFAFFDAGTMQRNDEGLFIGMHPHSGIGIITYFEGANLKHHDTGKNDNTIADGGVQWIRAGGGVWHEENYLKKANSANSWSLSIHQLWLQLPPELEESSVEYQNIQPELLPVVDTVKVIAGEYQGHRSPLSVPFNMSYFDVKLSAGDQFEFQTPKRQTMGFIFPRKGELSLFDDDLPLHHLSILENNEGDINVTAQTDTEFVIAMTEPSTYEAIAHGGSIHTSEKALDQSFERIRSLSQKLRTVGGLFF